MDWLLLPAMQGQRGRSLPDRPAVSGLLTVMMSVCSIFCRLLTRSLINNFKQNGGKGIKFKRKTITNMDVGPMFRVNVSVCACFLCADPNIVLV